MRAILFGLCCIISLAVGANDGRAEVTNGNALMRYCHEAGRDEHPNVLTGFCVGYILGIFESLVLSGRACVNLKVTNEQVRDVAVKFLEAHPEIRDRPAAALVIDASVETFPCH